MLIRREYRDGIQIIVGVPVRDEVLELGLGREDDGFHWTEVEKCVLNIHSKRVLASNVTFRDCEIVARKPIRDMNWFNVLFERCTFRGVFKMLSIGFAEHFHQDCPHGLDHCDLSQARFDSCELGGMDFATTRWPESPHVVFFHPGSHRDEIRAIMPEWPMQGLLQLMTRLDEACYAVACSVEYLKEYTRRKGEKIWTRM